MDRTQLLLLGLPIYLLFSDILNLFTPLPPPASKPAVNQYSQPQFQQSIPQPHHQPTLEFPTQKSSGIGGIGVGSTVKIEFCASCSYRGNAVTMKNMLETAYPGINIVLENYPPPLPKRLLSKVVPVVQVGVFGIIMAGEQIFPRLGFAVPPPFYYTLRANRFGSIASTWLLGNFVQSFLQSSGAFEVHCNGDLVYSKLKERRFPGEIELKDLVGRKLSNTRIVDVDGGALWS